MTERKQFKQRLSTINEDYIKYINAVVERDEAIAPLKFKFSIVLSLIEDLHYGTIERQQNVLSFLAKTDVNKLNAALYLPTGVLTKLVYSPESYLHTIEHEDGDLEEELL